MNVCRYSALLLTVESLHKYSSTFLLLTTQYTHEPSGEVLSVKTSGPILMNNLLSAYLFASLPGELPQVVLQP